MEYGYGRVSRDRQDAALQRDAFKRAGVRAVVTEKWSSVGERPKLQALISRLRPGDHLLVWKVDRMGRDLHDLLGLLKRIHAAGAEFRSLTEPIDTRTPLGKLVYSIAGAVAEYELNVIRERTRAGVQAARARGKTLGRPRVMEAADERELVDLLKTGLVSPGLAAEMFGVERHAVYNAMYRAGIRMRNVREAPDIC